MFEIKAIDHVVLRVRDVERMVRFYCDLLGCTRERDVAEVGLIQLRAGQALIDLVDVEGRIGQQGGAAPGREGRNLDHLCLRIEPFDPEAIARRFADVGLTTGPVERRYGAEGFGPSIYLQDPEGNTVELKGPPEAQAMDKPSAST